MKEKAMVEEALSFLVPCGKEEEEGWKKAFFEKIVANANFFPELRLDLKATVTMAKTGRCHLYADDHHLLKEKSLFGF